MIACRESATKIRTNLPCWCDRSGLTLRRSSGGDRGVWRRSSPCRLAGRVWQGSRSQQLANCLPHARFLSAVWPARRSGGGTDARHPLARSAGTFPAWAAARESLSRWQGCPQAAHREANRIASGSAHPHLQGCWPGADIEGGQGARGWRTLFLAAAREAEPGMTTRAEGRDPERAWRRLRENPDYVADWRASAGPTVREAPGRRCARRRLMSFAGRPRPT